MVEKWYSIQDEIFKESEKVKIGVTNSLKTNRKKVYKKDISISVSFFIHLKKCIDNYYIEKELINIYIN